MYVEYLSHGNINCNSDEECEYNTSMCIKNNTTSWFSFLLYLYPSGVSRNTFYYWGELCLRYNVCVDERDKLVFDKHDRKKFILSIMVCEGMKLWMNFFEVFN